MMEHQGSQRGGHYVIYLKFQNTWLCIDALNSWRQPQAPKMQRIVLVVLEKTNLVCFSEYYKKTIRILTNKNQHF